MKNQIIYMIMLLCLALTGCDRNDEQDEQKNDLARSHEDKITKVFFVANNNSIPSVFSYDMIGKEIKCTWTDPKEKVIRFTIHEKNKIAFILTALDYGRQGVFPFIRAIKLYRYNLLTERTEKIDEFGDAIQLFSKWITPNSYKITIISFDKKISTYVNLRSRTYGVTGSKQNDEKKTYDLVKEGYPENPEVPVDLSSPNQNFTFVKKRTVDGFAYYIKNIIDENAEFIAKSRHDLNMLIWSRDGKFLVFSTLDLSPANKTLNTVKPSTSDLFVYDLRRREIMVSFSGAGLRNFYVKGDLLIFDSGFGDESRITIYNLERKAIIKTVSPKGGAGINSIPQIPEYKEK